MDWLLQTHPNDVDVLASLPSSWSSNEDWLSIPIDPILIPPTSFNGIRDRTPIFIPNGTSSPPEASTSRNTGEKAFSSFTIRDKRGMSPEKAHEVSRMVAYLDSAFSRDELRYIVDVGAGQGYLTRTLRDCFSSSVLALEGNDVQTEGARRWSSGKTSGNQPVEGENQNDDDGIVHRTVHVTTETLVQAVDEWILSRRVSTTTNTPLRVMLVALHACGSLTPSIIRAFLQCSQERRRKWYFSNLIVVGCCYNLLHPSDFPLSEKYRSSEQASIPSIYNTMDIRNFPSSAFQLATQTPHRWNDSQETKRKALLAMKKVVWRALWGEMLREMYPDQLRGSNTGETPWSRKLGRLKDSAYVSWQIFLQHASQRTGIRIPLTSSREAICPPSTDSEPSNSFIANPSTRQALSNQLATLHVHRCHVGRIVEDIILDDRRTWVEEMIIHLSSQQDRDHGHNEDSKMQVELVNLFDQKMGSARNVAIVVRS